METLLGRNWREDGSGPLGGSGNVLIAVIHLSFVVEASMFRKSGGFLQFNANSPSLSRNCLGRVLAADHRRIQCLSKRGLI